MINIYMMPVLLLCVIILAVSFIIKKNYTVALMLFTTLIVAGASLRDMMLLNAAAQPLFWFAPVQMDDHAKKACNAAITVQKNLHTLFNQWNNKGKAPFLTRIGIHTGTVLVGNLGYKERLNYTVIGDTVNVSSRLENINKIYGTEIIVSENVFKKCSNDFEFRYLDRVYLLGRYNAMNIYELISLKDNIDKLQRKINEHYEHGLKNYFDEKWLFALKHFNTVIKYRPNDTPSRLMRERCLLYKDNPPPEDWDGVFSQTVK